MALKTLRSTMPWWRAHGNPMDPHSSKVIPADIDSCGRTVRVGSGGIFAQSSEREGSRDDDDGAVIVIGGAGEAYRSGSYLEKKCLLVIEESWRPMLRRLSAERSMTRSVSPPAAGCKALLRVVEWRDGVAGGLFGGGARDVLGAFVMAILALLVALQAEWL